MEEGDHDRISPYREEEASPKTSPTSELRKAAEIGQTLLLAKMELSAKLEESNKEKKKLETSLREWNDFASKLGASSGPGKPSPDYIERVYYCMATLMQSASIQKLLHTRSGAWC
jgi:hypothetical protein